MNLFSYVKGKISIVDVVHEYTQLKRAGLYWKGTCPFHHEKTASFTVSPGKEIFYCFGCHVGGDVIAFIERIENCTPVMAVNHLIDRYHIDVPDAIKLHDTEKKSGKRQDYFQLCSRVAHWAHEQLLNDKQAINYLQARSISSKSIDLYMLGLFPGGARALKSLLSAMASHSIIAKDLLTANILVEGAHGLYSPFEDRILFPIRDHLARCCGFGGRIYQDGDTRAKYYNSKENDFFQKGTLLFGLDVAKKQIQEAGAVFLVEGYTDCIAMAQNGYQNSVAALGTACTIEHLHTLARFAHKVYVVYDGDNAGQTAMLRMAQLCWQSSLDLYAIRLDVSDDPASLFAAGKSFAEYVQQAQDIFSFFVQSMGAHFATQSLQEKLRMAASVVELLSHVENSLKLDILLQKASQEMDIPIESLKKEMQYIRGGKKHEQIPLKNVENVPESVACEPSKIEKRIFAAILNNIQLVNGQREEYLILYTLEPIRSLLLRLKQEIKIDSNLSFAQFFDRLDDASKHFISKVVAEYDENMAHEEFVQCVHQFQRIHWKRMTKDIVARLEQAKKNGQNDLAHELVQEFLELKKRVLENIAL